MTGEQLAARKFSDQTIRAAQGDMLKALGALYEIFSHRLYRNQFRTFENFCFAMYGTHRINDELMKKVKARTNALKSEINNGRGSFKTPVYWGLCLDCLNEKAGGASVFHG